ncbi:MAG: hypothetical protein U0W40_16180 [Acidimicrobiia bacterium]
MTEVGSGGRAAARRRRPHQRLVATRTAGAAQPKPYGLEGEAVEQLVIEEEFRAAGIEAEDYGITGWVILVGAARHRRPGRRWVQPCARPGAHLVSALQQRARRVPTQRA